MSFRRRLALFLVITLVGVQALTAIFSYRFVRNNVIEQGKNELSIASLVFMQQLDALAERVSQDVEVLTLDFPLRQAIAHDDRETAFSALRNHGRRINATRMMLVELDGKVTVDTAHPDLADAAFPFPEMLKEASVMGRAMALTAIGDRIFWIVAVPVNAPVPIAYVAAGVPVNDALVEDLRRLSALPASIMLAVASPDGTLLRSANSASHPPSLHGPAGTLDRATTAISEDQGKEYLTLATPLRTAPESAPVIVILDYPLEDALARYQGIIFPVAIVFAVALLVAIPGAWLIARSVSRPVEALAETAHRIEAGDYSAPKILVQKDEIGQLSHAISGMTRAIRDRETALGSAVVELEMARDEAVRANRAKSQFLANMSHELRTPLNAIIGFSNIMAEEMMGPLGSERYREYARDIYGCGQHLLTLVEEMLDLAKIEAGTLAIARARVAPGALLSACLTMLRPIAEKADVTLEILGNPEAWPGIDADEIKIKQVFINLIGNAIKFTPSGGKVTVSGEVAGGNLVIRVTDTGIGIEPKDIPLVTQPFYRVNSALDAKYPGAGLGLPLAKTVVELHGGALSIASRIGEGTAVTVSLPLAKAKTEAA